MKSQKAQNPKQQLLVWWILWAAFVVGIFQVYYFLAMSGSSPKPQAPATNPFIAAFGLLPVAVSAIIRWSILPRIQSARVALPIFIIGIALAEASCYMGLFIFPAFKAGFFVFSVIGMFQFIPFFARRYFEGDARD